MRRLSRILSSRFSTRPALPENQSSQRRSTHRQQAMLRKLTATAATTNTSGGLSVAASAAIGAPISAPSKNAKPATSVPIAPVRAAPPPRSVELGPVSIPGPIGRRRCSRKRLSWGSGSTAGMLPSLT